MEKYIMMKHKRKNNLKIDLRQKKSINCPWLMTKLSTIYTITSWKMKGKRWK